ncbi:MAG: hypothetical protein AAF633_26495, partial [Chloroflexota bacterium]
TQPDPFQMRFMPALNGLRLAANGERLPLPPKVVPPAGRWGIFSPKKKAQAETVIQPAPNEAVRFLGWTLGSHWLLVE